MTIFATDSLAAIGYAAWKGKPKKSFNPSRNRRCHITIHNLGAVQILEHQKEQRLRNGVITWE